MTSKERYLNMLSGKECDIVPRIPILMQFAAEYIGSNYGAFASDHNILVEANLKCAEDFGMDQVSTISDPYRETAGFGAEIEFIPDGVPRCVSTPLENDKDLSRLTRPDPQTSIRMRDRIDAITLYRKLSGDKYSILGWVEGPVAEAADLRGVSQFLMDMIEDETYATSLMELCADNAIAFALAQIEAGADTIGIGDAIASQISTDMYRQMILPQERRIVEAIHEAGGLVRLHICGNITHLLSDIKELHVDVLDLDHMVDMAVVRKTLGKEVALSGNIDPAADVRFGNPEVISQKINEIYQSVDNPYFVNAGCEIPSGTPIDNLMALCKPITCKRSAD